MDAAGDLPQVIDHTHEFRGYVRNLGPVLPRPADASAAERSLSASVTSRCCAPSCRSRSIRRREAVSAGNKAARDILGDVLEDQCRDTEAEQVWRDAIAAGDSHAWVRVGLLILDFDHNNDSQLEAELIDMDRADDAIAVWQQGIDEGARGATRIWLGRLLELCGRLDEAEQMWRQALAEADGDVMSKLTVVC